MARMISLTIVCFLLIAAWSEAAYSQEQFPVTRLFAQSLRSIHLGFLFSPHGLSTVGVYSLLEWKGEWVVGIGHIKPITYISRPCR